MIQVSKELLHRLVDELPEEAMRTAAELLEALRERGAGGLPYPECIRWGHEPNEETIRALEESRAGIGLTSYESLDEMMHDLDSD
jgi:hypothetical protein